MCFTTPPCSRQHFQHFYQQLSVFSNHNYSCNHSVIHSSLKSHIITSVLAWGCQFLISSSHLSNRAAPLPSVAYYLTVALLKYASLPLFCSFMLLLCVNLSVGHFNQIQPLVLLITVLHQYCTGKFIQAISAHLQSLEGAKASISPSAKPSTP